MASWLDVFSLVVTTFFFVGSILGVLYAVRAISSHFQSTKVSLEQKGIALSRGGVSFKTEKRFDRDDYLDATQRGFVKVLGSATVGSASRKHSLLSNPTPNPNAASTSNVNPVDVHEREKHMFGVTLRRSHSGGREEGH